MDKSNSVQHPDELRNADSGSFEVIYDERKCLICQYVNAPDFIDAINTHDTAEILVFRGGTLEEVPAEVKRLHKLQIASVTESEITQFPMSLLELQYLSLLDLSDNKLLSIPNEIRNISLLRVLDFSKNSVACIPEGLYDLENLQSLNMSNNKICELSASVGKMKGLQALDCSYNLFRTLPEEVGCLLNLLVLRLMNNKLCFLPRSFSNLSSLLILQLDNNVFDHIPAQLFSCFSLVELSFSNNLIHGMVPSDLSHLVHLRTLNLAHNRFTQFCEGIGALEKLEYINLSGNSAGYLDFNLLKLQQLQELSLSGCGLSCIPEDLAFLHNLIFLNLSNNKIKDLPNDVKFPKLTALFLSKNLFSFLPSWICCLKNLVVLELQYNNLANLPHEFENLLSTLRQLDLSFNSFITMPPCIFCPKNRLTYLCLDSNPLTHLPENISLLCDLTHLSVSHCSQLHSLPNGLSECTNLRMLRLSHCSLNFLPNSFTNLHSLKYLELSHNQFEYFPVAVCFLPRLRVLLYDQMEGRPLVPLEDPKGWFARSGILFPEETMEVPVTDSNLEELKIFETLDEAVTAQRSSKLALPPLIGKLSQLVHLSLQGNGLFILPDVFHLMKLRRLNLSHNRLHFLPPNFHRSKNLTHLYLHNNQLKRLQYNFKCLYSLTVLTVADNPLICPPVDVCSGRKVSPVYAYLRQQKLFEVALLRSMCATVIQKLPKDSYTSFLQKLGFPAEAVDLLGRELPGGYNHTKRVHMAMQAWTGLTLELETPTKTLTATGMYDPTTGTETNRQLTPAIPSVLPQPSSSDGTEDANRFTEDVKSITAQETQSSHSVALASVPVYPYAEISVALRKSVTGPEASPHRLLHVVYLLGLQPLHDELNYILHLAQRPRF
ncbi:hypothetical protein PHET_05592 [Paragonimus heterotremus]|uniref:Disease resistance R13L4/SHOC-2-like LRR domain-containing protein n=1 Tax=Paragonimus heterotremus TaxID=100268 RepID=A0A8J4SKW6_9TREM|nr:hypothetical protein PHET_05592 [Paragonimus heterotremus]